MASDPLERVRRDLARYDDAMERAQRQREKLLDMLREYEKASGCRCLSIEAARQLIDWTDKMERAA